MTAKIDEVREVKARPHKLFFIDMITRDISLEACVLDLIDNSVDGATRSTEDSPAPKRSPKPHPLSSGGSRYKGHKIEVTLSNASFAIKDNCGGIPVDIACEYAFNFGRDPKKQTDADTESGIGIYGIGMKRALFKLGKKFSIASHTAADAFEMDVDVDKWAALPDDEWSMELTTTKPSSKDPGTVIEVTSLRKGVAQELATAGFATRLSQAAGRTYAAFLDQGLDLRVNGTRVAPTEFTFLDGHGFQPHHARYKESLTLGAKPSSAVDVEIWAGAAGAVTSVKSGSEEEDGSIWGWYVLCNNRVVLSANKAERTGWGLASFPQWHPQYYGFVGIVSFRSEEPYALPWTTTKNDIDVDSAVYRRARTKMQEAARKFVNYSRARKGNPTEAKRIEREAKPIRVIDVSSQQPMRTPAVPGATDGEVSIQYMKSKRKVAKAARALGDANMSATQVGSQSFDYYYSNEVVD